MNTVLNFPAIGVAARPEIHLDLHRETTARMADWQAAIIRECQRHEELCPAIFDFLKRTKLLHRCTFLASDVPGGPLLFRYIGAPTIAVLGRGWARQQLGQPEEEDPFEAVATTVGAQYVEAISGGEALFNTVATTGMGSHPMSFDHALFGWEARDGRRAVLSAITLH